MFILVVYHSKWFFCVASLEEIFVKYDSYFFSLTKISVYAPYSVYVLIYCCAGYVYTDSRVNIAALNS